ncbi:hypothetical protein CCHR01_04756 [Colletotrichum chrysophilum]|uniref:Uncharacterized protein n=1 Tax=Colletotrichum chrysophilum TaxID=1836956 RepID=A0AAD9EM88_9PEZI|nr:hypothetical protein CCHR01_04756 [Colletotrichum chrysophilum]
MPGSPGGGAGKLPREQGTVWIWVMAPLNDCNLTDGAEIGLDAGATGLPPTPKPLTAASSESRQDSGDAVPENN